MKLFNASREAEERLADFKQLNITDDQRHRDQIDGFKLYFDLLKQVTTLSTGSAILVATLIDRLFHEPKSKILVAASLLCFFLSLCASVIGMLGYASKVRLSNPRNRDDVREMGLSSSVAAIAGFLDVWVNGMGVSACVVKPLPLLLPPRRPGRPSMSRRGKSLRYIQS